MKVVLGIAGSVAAVLALGWVFGAWELSLTRVFAPRMEAVRRDTFEQSKAFNQGMAQELEAMMLDYGKASDAQKATIASIALHRLADYDETRLPSHLRGWVTELRAERAR